MKFSTKYGFPKVPTDVSSMSFSLGTPYFSLTSLYFSSEIKALFSAGITSSKNEKVWANYFAFGSYGMPNETFYESISQLPGSHYLEFQKNELTIKKWYFFEKEIGKNSWDSSECSAEQKNSLYFA